MGKTMSYFSQKTSPKLALLMLSFLGLAIAPTVSVAANKSKLSIYQHGKPVNALPCGTKTLRTRTAVLMGGGTDVAQTFTRMIDRMTKCSDGSVGNPGNFVVIRAGGNPAYDSYIAKQGPVAAVITIVVPDRDSALAIGDATNEVGQQVQALLKTAGAIFLTGGDQGDYYDFWSNRTPFIPLQGTVTDSHYDTRDRMGRLATFLADSISLGWVDSSSARGIGVDQETALVMEYVPSSTGNSSKITYTMEVMANPGVNGAAYLLSAGSGSTLTVPQSRALKINNINVQKISVDGSSSSYQLNVRAGVLSSPTGVIY